MYLVGPIPSLGTLDCIKKLKLEPERVLLLFIPLYIADIFLGIALK